MARTQKLTVPMRGALTAIERFGALYRRPGGVWSVKPLDDASFDLCGDIYFKTVTITALKWRRLIDLRKRRAGDREVSVAVAPGAKED